MPPNDLIVRKELRTLALIIERPDGEELRTDDATAFASKVLEERDERDAWDYDGFFRENYHCVKVFFAQ